ncbi:MAG: type IX secretion system sortase PorU [Paludibacter sp.]
MKVRLYIIVFFCLFILRLSAQNQHVSSISIAWQGVEKVSLDSSSIKLISFSGAQYPNDNRLPYFNKRIIADSHQVYSVKVINQVYIPVTTEESKVIGTSQFGNEPEIVSKTLQSRGTSYFDVSVLPFISKDAKVLKLKSFDLQINSVNSAQKVAAINNRTYATNSVLAQGKFVKIRVVNTGVYKLTYEDLVSMGVDPANVRIFGYGGNILDQSFASKKIDDLSELSIYMNNGADGIFNSGDYVLFYAQGINKWAYDSSKSMFTHTINSYSKYGYYFVTSDAGIGKKISDEVLTVPDGATINPVDEFLDYQVYEKDLQNLTSSGKEFYGETFNDVLSYNLPFSFPNPVNSNSTIVRLDVAGSTSTASNFTLTLNGTQAKTLTVSARTQGDNYEQAKGASSIFTFTPLQNNTFNFNISFTKSVTSSVGYLNYLEVNARRQLVMSGSAMQFQNIDYLGSGTYNKYLLSNTNSNVQIWDITDPQNISNIKASRLNNTDTLSFVDSGNDLKSYIAIDPTTGSDFSKPEIIGTVPNQNIHAIMQSDLVIISHPNFLTQAQNLAQAHRDKDNLTVSVVTTDQVYNEFSSGTPDATAYRWIMKMLYDRALNSNNTLNMPKYLLLFGRGSYDNRKIISNSGDNYILTYQAENSLVTTLSYTTDDYFALLDDNEGSQIPANLMDIGVGRLPITTVQQATDVVNKTIGYINNTDKGSWKNQLCFLADDGDAALHMKQADSIAVSNARNFPSYQLNKIYLDAYNQEVSASGQSYPVAKTQVLNLIQNGIFLLDFTGHAGATGLTNESVISLADVKKMSNKHLPFMIGATCDFLQFDVQTVSGGEQFVLNPNGGGIGILSAARPVYASQNFTLNKLVCDNLFKKQNGKELRLGDIISTAKNNVGTEINKLSYMFMGDPAVRLNFPTNFKVITSKVNKNTTFGNDTLRALSVATVEGYIADENGDTITDFNGTLHAEVYDKVQKITTLNNEGDGSMTYSDRPNTLFSGNADVKNGIFTFVFMLPKDIKYNYGGGRINYYAADETKNVEAQGFFENFTVGGTDKNSIYETDGPVVNLYLNSDGFVSGDKVNESPLFVANVSDTHGINTVGSGIGHDVSLTIDQDPTQSYILNDYFEASANSYTSGTVKYKLPQMLDGKHTLSFKVCDLLNNSTTSTAEFEVVTGLAPHILSISNYPNPVSTKTNIIVKHDRPETILNTLVEIFDLSGRKVWSFSQSSADNISWNLISNDGLKVKSGIYLYRVSVKTSDSDVTSKTNKMWIVEQ